MILKNPLLRFGLFLATFVAGFVLTLTIRVASGFKSDGAIPVALVEEAPRSNVKPVTIKLQWGGFYAFKEDRQFKIFRLLEINQDEVHIKTYSETFREMPSVHDVTFLIPENEHKVWSGPEFLSAKPVFIGGKSLYANDLQQYGRYLIRTGIKGTELARNLDRAIRFSRDVPLETRLSVKDGVLEFDQA
ncbi:MAG: hypothetical protein P1V20_26950, partial [Verrucomicrobiales bacterium]|nr:hypothetical protein [Verrucomicrobiales bacterium]